MRYDPQRLTAVLADREVEIARALAVRRRDLARRLHRRRCQGETTQRAQSLAAPLCALTTHHGDCTITGCIPARMWIRVTAVVENREADFGATHVDSRA